MRVTETLKILGTLQMRVVAIIIKDDKILLIHRIKNGQEYFVFPGILNGKKKKSLPETISIILFG